MSQHSSQSTLGVHDFQCNMTSGDYLYLMNWFLYNYISCTTTHPVQLHIPYNYTSCTTTHLVQLHIPYNYTLYNYTSCTTTHLVQLHIPYNHTSRTTTHLVQLYISYNYTSRTTTHLIQLHIPYNYISRTTTHSVQLLRTVKMALNLLFIMRKYIALVYGNRMASECRLPSFFIIILTVSLF